ncbi:MAG: hypothetical protein PVG07_00555 [Acidobacteriota bacterium]
MADEVAAVAGDLDERQPLYVAWDVPLLDPTERPADVAADVEATRRVRAAQVTPWVRLIFTTPPSLVENTERLDLELEAVAALAREAAPDTHFQVVWEPTGSDAAAFDAASFAFLLKRASVALTGARPDATVLAGPVPASVDALNALYDNEIGAYLDGLAVEPAPTEVLEEIAATLTALDPGRPLVVDRRPEPSPAATALADAARGTAAGVAVTFFELPEIRPETVTPFVVLAREFRGDLSYDPGYGPAGADGAWSFVREDLSLRVIAETGSGPAELRFDDPTLLSPEEVDPATGAPRALFGIRRTAEGLVVPVPADGPVTVVRLERGQAVDLEQYEERVTVADERRMPVEEILRRLQAFEDAQARKLDHYSAVNTTHLRFGAGAGVQSVEATLEGPFFFERQAAGPDDSDRGRGGFDWAWKRFYINGIRWKGETIPEIPLVQPEKAAVMPIQISFTRQYDYRLVGTETVDGRDCWVVEFRPAVAPEEGKLYRGRVWVDRELFARVRSRAVQLGLEGEVLSNEEILHYAPVDASGRPAPWSEDSFFLPLRLTGQQLISVVNATTLVERETILSEIEINGADFGERRAAVMESDVTMVRDTDKGLRYLVKEEGVEGRVVQEDFDTSRLFALGGVFYDDSLDYPLPLAGANYLDFDFRETGNQLNLFFGGALLTANYADPRLAGSRWDLGGDAFALAIPVTDSQYRDGVERPGEEVELRTGNVSVKVGRPLGNFVKLGAEYEVSYRGYEAGDDTADAFRVPSDHFRHTFELRSRFARSGYSLSLAGSYNLRSRWEEWGFPGNPEYSEEHEDYLLWSAGLAKSWYLPRFQKIGLELDYVDGSDLDRFSKYGFGFFGGTRIHGFPSGEVRAEEAALAHLSYGFDIGEVFRIEAVGDAALASDPVSGLDEDFLAGAGIQGTLLGPWETVINFDVGVPIEGTDDGFTAYVVFLKLFDWDRLEHWLDPTEAP